MGARGPKPGMKVGGRQKGTPNKIPASIKQMVLEALSAEGGVEYLRKQAKENPAPFLTMLAKIIPQQIANEDEKTFEIRITERIVDPRS